MASSTTQTSSSSSSLPFSCINLTQDIQLPSVGFGTYLIKDEDTIGADGNTIPGAKTCVLTALRHGYRHIDTAQVYANEHGVGEGIHAGMVELGLARGDIFVTTKLWPGNPAWGHPAKTYDTTIAALNESLEKLQLDYVDLYLIHAPFCKDERLNQWRALVELKAQGKAKAIGVSNFNKEHIEEIKAAGLPLPDANQIELHPWSQKNDLVAYLVTANISPIAYSSLVPLSTWRQSAGAGKQASAKTDKMKADGQDIWTAIAKKYGVTEAQLLLRWGLQKGYAILPKSTTEARIAQNLDLFGFEISDEDMATMGGMDRGDGVAWQSGDPIKEA